ncbi:UvrD-helicase domain-containing protein [Picosynechococcus sp. PCC 7117]|uniref:UvrD-helicase domain-containing protein n=1 Tax=Picosynechococcus sp. PCC 7117 TaxID=195498 RepID=UPI000810DA41|nr:UvrD-helicase domain-containing protein [Picosynechococcus sp. PCC 7117]ANV89126.1 hypothetical protein AWQ22_16175 [Picosynechococcus sp. PCC 7117]
MNFAPSQYQRAIFNWVQNGNGHALIEAVAGSGKTTTLIKASQLIYNKRILFCAFNKHIQQEISHKISHHNSDIKTVHSIGFGCISRYLKGRIQPVEQYKYSALVKRDFYYAIEGDLQAYLAQFSKNEQNIKKNKMFTELEEFIKYIRMTLTNPDNTQEIQDLIEHFSLETEYLDIFLPYVREIIDRGEEIARIERVIDYTDMVWLPYYWSLKPQQYEWIFVDEAQDLNKASLDLILKSCSKNGRIIFVGDEKQAIYGFSGADSQSIKNIQKVTGAQRFPLSICYRCPKSHIKLSKDIVPHIEAAPDVIYGFVKKIDEDEMLSKIQTTDLVLCRLNYPLIRTALDLISRKIPASITRQNVADAMIEILFEIEAINKNTRFC